MARNYFEFKPGANTQIAIIALSQADPDGHTLLYGGNGLAWTGVACNFVTSLDGIVTFGLGDGGGLTTVAAGRFVVTTAAIAIASPTAAQAAST